MRIALIAHDAKKQDMLEFVKQHQGLLGGHQLMATRTTGCMLVERLGLPVNCYLSGPMGGDLQIGAELAGGHVDLLIFLRDPMTAQPHEPDIAALLRACDVHNVPCATNLVTAHALLAHCA
jgi:methylglyoxal synthase